MASFVPPPSPSPYLRTLLAYCDAAKELDHAKMMDLFDDNLQYYMLPKSLGKPVMNKEQYAETLTGLLSPFKALRVSFTVIITWATSQLFDLLLISSTDNLTRSHRSG